MPCASLPPTFNWLNFFLFVFPSVIIRRPWHYCRAFTLASYQIRKIAGCTWARNAGDVCPATDFNRKPPVSDPDMHHGTCVRRMRNTQFYVSGNRPMEESWWPPTVTYSITCGDDLVKLGYLQTRYRPSPYATSRPRTRGVFICTLSLPSTIPWSGVYSLFTECGAAMKLMVHLHDKNNLSVANFEVPPHWLHWKHL